MRDAATNVPVSYGGVGETGAGALGKPEEPFVGQGYGPAAPAGSVVHPMDEARAPSVGQPAHTHRDTTSRRGTRCRPDADLDRAAMATISEDEAVVATSQVGVPATPWNSHAFPASSLPGPIWSLASASMTAETSVTSLCTCSPSRCTGSLISGPRCP